MTNENNSSTKIKEFFKRKPVIISAVALVIIIICAIALVITSGNNKKSGKGTNTATETTSPSPSTTPTKKPIQLPSTGAAVSSEEAVETQTPDSSSDNNTTTKAPETTKDVTEEEFEDVMGPTNEEAALAALEKKEQTEANQETFDSYIEKGDYSSAYDLLENFFKNNSYANRSLATYKNYVTYYEKQELYNESIAFQLDYIEKNDGLENVRQESVHYQTLEKSLEKVPNYQDNRLATINESVATWKQMTDAINNKDYTTVINTTKDYIKNGKESVTAYLYLTTALRESNDRFEEAKVYYCYLGLDDSGDNQLEFSYYTLFLNQLTQMYYNDAITNEQMEYIENDFDYVNYLKQ